MDRSDITGIILCGGKARRLGHIEKPLIRVDGVRIVDRIVDRLRPQVAQILISCGTDPGAFAGLGLPIVQDRRPDEGPLAGIEAGLIESHTTWCFVCPGDAPAIGTDIVSHLLSEIGDSEIAFPHDGSRDQHLFMLIRRETLPSLTAALDDDVRSVADWVGARRAARVHCSDTAQFLNINTVADLELFGSSTRSRTRS